MGAGLLLGAGIGFPIGYFLIPTASAPDAERLNVGLISMAIGGGSGLVIGLFTGAIIGYTMQAQSYRE